MMTDEEFREAYQSVQVPAHYDAADTQENKILFALAQLGEGTAASVIGELEKLEPGLLNAQVIALTKTVLSALYEKGLLTGHEENGLMYYNFHKIKQANDGATGPDQ